MEDCLDENLEVFDDFKSLSFQSLLKSKTSYLPVIEQLQETVCIQEEDISNFNLKVNNSRSQKNITPLFSPNPMSNYHFQSGDDYSKPSRIVPPPKPKKKKPKKVEEEIFEEIENLTDIPSSSISVKKPPPLNSYNGNTTTALMRPDTPTELQNLSDEELIEYLSSQSHNTPPTVPTATTATENIDQGPDDPDPLILRNNDIDSRILGKRSRDQKEDDQESEVKNKRPKKMRKL